VLATHSSDPISAPARQHNRIHHHTAALRIVTTPTPSIPFDVEHDGPVREAVEDGGSDDGAPYDLTTG